MAKALCGSFTLNEQLSERVVLCRVNDDELQDMRRFIKVTENKRKRWKVGTRKRRLTDKLFGGWMGGWMDG